MFRLERWEPLLPIAPARGIGHNIFSNRGNFMFKTARILIWFSVVLLGAMALATVALHRGEQINAMWLVVAAICTCLLDTSDAADE